MACETRIESRAVRGDAVAHGRALFDDPKVSQSPLNRFACSTCHPAPEGTPSDRIFPGGSLAGATLRATFWADQENDLLRSINDCRYYFMNAQDPWADNGVEAQAFYAYLKTLDGSPSAVPFTVVLPIKDMAAGDPQTGADLFERACRTCHGALHTGDLHLAAAAPVLPDQTVREHPGLSPADVRGVFITKIRHGGFITTPGNMPLFSSEMVSDAQIAGLLAYFELYP
jgi:thiosulfate dehydrogenase